MFVVFEGLDGCGKTTQVERVAKQLRERGMSVVTTCEPDTSDLGNSIREMVSDFIVSKHDARTMALLFNAARSLHVKEVIEPALREGKVVLCDRFSYSTIVYQGFGYGEDRAMLENVVKYATGGLEPDCVVFLQVWPETAARRVLERQQECEKTSEKLVDFFYRVHEGYRYLMWEDPNRWFAVYGEKAVDLVTDNIIYGLNLKLPHLIK